MTRGSMRFLVLGATLGLLPFAAGAAGAAADPSGPRGPYLLADAETGQVIDHFDAQRPWYPASTTKLMTIYTVFRAVLAGEIDLDTPIAYTENAAAQPASKMAFPVGTKLTLDDALKIMMVKSANDIAVAVAEAVGGSVPGFAERMNREAARLGMQRSHFVNPHGLPDPGQVTTARDMALVARALLVEFPQHRPYYKIHAIKFGGKVLKNFNPLLERYPGANGMKTGFICASGYNLVASARRGEREVIAVVFGEYNGTVRAEHAAELLEEGFQAAQPLDGTVATLQDVSSGTAYTEPLDMGPFVCGRGKAQTASDNAPAETQTRGVSAAGVALAAVQKLPPVSPLGPPLYLGPPVEVSIQVPPKPPKLDEALDSGGSGLTVRIPRARPARPEDPQRPHVADAFAPSVEGTAARTPPAVAIGVVTGAPQPLRSVQPQ